MKARTLLLAGFILTAPIGSADSFGAAPSSLTQTDAGGGVTARVTYLNPKSSDEPRFQLVLDTHSVALDGYDLKNLTALRDDTGKDYLPIGAENKGGGHHRETTLIFPQVSREAKRLEIVIKDVARVKERTFRWNLE